MYNNLLKRQLDRYIKDYNNLQPEWQSFLEAVDRSYEHYERDHLLGKRSIEISSSELRELAVDLQDKEKRISAFIEAATDGILVINESNEIEICNQSSLKFFGAKNSEEIIGKKIDLFQFVVWKRINEKLDVDIPKVETLADIFSTTPKNTLCEIFFIKDDNVPLPIELSNSELSLSHRNLKICIMRDISLRKQSEKKIGLRHEVTRLLLESSSLQDVNQQILSLICLQLDLDAAYLWLYDKETKRMKPSFFYTAKHIFAQEDFQKHDHEYHLTSKFTDNIQWLTSELKLTSETSESNELLKKWVKYFPELRTYINFPIIFENELYGYIELFSQRNLNRDEGLIKILKDIGSELGMFIERQNARQREIHLQQQLITTARQAGMMQVAASVLHNVGNVLNSINISSTLLEEMFKNSELTNLSKVAEMILDHRHELDHFIVHNEQGKHLPEYIVALAEAWQKESQNMQKEIKLLAKNIDHIKGVIKTQQSLCNLGGLKEKTSINTIIDDLITMKSNQIDKLGISVKKQFDFLPDVLIDRSRLQQVIENLIHNAIDALKVKEEGHKNLTIRTALKNEIASIEVIDDGCGIKNDDLERIFSFGFTTKKDGHGFGLHSSAILIKELGGELTGRSHGIGKGAVFTIALPIKEH